MTNDQTRMTNEALMTKAQLSHSALVIHWSFGPGHWSLSLLKFSVDECRITCYHMVTCEDLTHGPRLESFVGSKQTENAGSARGAATHYRRAVGVVSEALAFCGYETPARASCRRINHHPPRRAGTMERPQSSAAA